MKHKKKNNAYYLLLESGEKVIATLSYFLKREKIVNGYFTGIGAVSFAELMFFDTKQKKYLSKLFRGDKEVLNITGNVSLLENKPFIHAHITIADKNYKTIGGHLKEATVGASLEISLVKSDVNLHRNYQQNSGLSLWNFD